MKMNGGALFYTLLLWITNPVIGRISRNNIFQTELSELNVDADPEVMIVSHKIINKTFLDANVTMFLPIARGDTSFSMLIRIHSGAGDFYQTLLKYTGEDFCEHWMTASKDPLLRLALGRARKFTNLKGCPLEAGEYFLRNFTANGIIPVGIIPDGEYIINASLHQKNLANGKVNISLVVIVIN